MVEETYWERQKMRHEEVFWFRERKEGLVVMELTSLMVKLGRDGTPPWMAPTDSSCPLYSDPDAVTITSCISTQGGYGVILTWSCPTGGYEAFELQVGEQQVSQDRSSCETGVSVWGLQPAQAYAASVTTIWSTMRAAPASVTCHTESTGEQSIRGQRKSL